MEVAEYGGQLVQIEYSQGCSTSEVIQRILDSFGMRSGDDETDELRMQRRIIPNASYFRLETHELLLRDTVRVEAFRRAINKVVKPGDIVLDLGTGTGILAFLSYQAGAQRIYAVEREQIVRLARVVAEHNGYTSDMIQFLEGDSNAVELPHQVDVLISECLGSFGINTMMLCDFFKTRDRFLKPEGRIIPTKMTLLVAPFSSPAILSDISYWDTPRYGVDFSPVRALASNQVYLVLPRDISFLAPPSPVYHLDFLVDNDVQLSSQCTFKVDLPGRMVGICGWFEVELTSGILLSTSPESPPTSWYQVMFPLGTPVDVATGDCISLSLSNRYESPMIEWKWNVIIERDGGQIAGETHSSCAGFPRAPTGMVTSYYPSF